MRAKIGLIQWRQKQVSTKAYVNKKAPIKSGLYIICYAVLYFDFNVYP